MNYLITGITGFLGPHLANLLIKNGHTVYALVRTNNGRENDIRDIVEDSEFQKIIFVYGDLIDFRAMDKIFKTTKFDGVFHLAAQSHPPTSFTDPIMTWETNVMGSINLITAIADRQPECKLLFCSTVEVYGNEGIDGRNIKEDNTFLPANPYGASKAAIDMYLQERIKNKQINCVIVRPFCFTGPRRGSKFSISSDAIQIARMMLGKQEKVLKIGNLDTVRIVADVRDIANAFFLIMLSDNTSGQTYNVSAGQPQKMRYYTDTLIKLSGLENVSFEIEPKFWRPIDIQYQDGDSSKLIEELGWKPEYTIETTLSDLLQYWLKKIA
jgi:GDP-4-dehydro-6-deoxy-D-mannose reductase